MCPFGMRFASVQACIFGSRLTTILHGTVAIEIQVEIHTRKIVKIVSLGPCAGLRGWVIFDNGSLCKFDLMFRAIGKTLNIPVSTIG